MPVVVCHSVLEREERVTERGDRERQSERDRVRVNRERENTSLSSILSIVTRRRRM